jgi:2-polyprenyl-6-methoxyphenol hydroxylase-like FAD-dependent oxidoreductase
METPRSATRSRARFRRDNGEGALHARIEVACDGANDLIRAYIRCGESQAVVGSNFDLVLDIDEFREQLFLCIR